MGQNADTMKTGYEAFARGDMETVMSIWNDDIRWEGANHPALPGSGVTEGKQQIVEQVFGDLPNHYDEFSVSPDEFLEDGETVVVLGHQHSRAKASGQEVQVPFVHVWRMRDGKASRAQILTDTAVIAEALGLLHEAH